MCHLNKNMDLFQHNWVEDLSVIYDSSHMMEKKFNMSVYTWVHKYSVCVLTCIYTHSFYHEVQRCFGHYLGAFNPQHNIII